MIPPQNLFILTQQFHLPVNLFSGKCDLVKQEAINLGENEEVIWS